MSVMYALMDLDQMGWGLHKEDLAPNYFDLHIGFDGNGQDIVFNELKFGFELRHGAETVASRQWPPTGVQYKRTNQTYIVFHRFTMLEPGEEYRLFLWMNANEDIYEKIYTFTMPTEPLKLTHLQFLRKFSPEEVGAFEVLLADSRNGTSSLPTTERAQVLTMGRLFEAARDVRLDDPQTIQFVNALANMGILSPTRVTEILGQ